MRPDRGRVSLVTGLAMIMSVVIAGADAPTVVPSLHLGAAMRIFTRPYAAATDDGGLVAVTAPPVHVRPSPSLPTASTVDTAVPNSTVAPRASAAARAAPGTPAPVASTITTATCPPDWFCYPRLSIRGPIVPYTDCFGTTDIGTDVRAFTCLSPRYLMGHAYTQMGRITGWQAGDAVFAYGQAFVVSGALTSRSCDPPQLPLAPLSMQTSLSTSACGPVLVVQAR